MQKWRWGIYLISLKLFKPFLTKWINTLDGWTIWSVNDIGDPIGINTVELALIPSKSRGHVMLLRIPLSVMNTLPQALTATN